MSMGEKLQTMSDEIDRAYKPSFVSKTQRLLDKGVNEMHPFLDASLNFMEGNATWKSW